MREVFRAALLSGEPPDACHDNLDASMDQSNTVSMSIDRGRVVRALLAGAVGMTCGFGIYLIVGWATSAPVESAGQRQFIASVVATLVGPVAMAAFSTALQQLRPLNHDLVRTTAVEGRRAEKAIIAAEQALADAETAGDLKSEALQAYREVTEFVETRTRELALNREAEILGEHAELLAQRFADLEQRANGFELEARPELSERAAHLLSQPAEPPISGIEHALRIAEQSLRASYLTMPGAWLVGWIADQVAVRDARKRADLAEAGAVLVESEDADAESCQLPDVTNL